MRKLPLLASAFALLLTTPAFAETGTPDAAKLKTYVEKLVSFGTRHTLSSADDPKRGIGAARRWAKSEFEAMSKACNGCLTVEMLERQMSGPRAPNGVNIVDVLAIKPGKMGWGHVIIIAGHIDSRVSDVMDFTKDAPGANDDGSGSALVIEAARLMSKQPQTEATIVFALLSGEEQGLMGGRLIAETAKERGWKVTAMLNNDIVGNTIGTDGRKVDNVVRIFSEGIRASEDITAQLARRVVVKQRGTHALERRQLESHRKGIAKGRELVAIGAPTENGLVLVEVALHAQPEMPGRDGWVDHGLARRHGATALEAESASAAGAVVHLQRCTLGRLHHPDPSIGRT